MCNHNRVAIHTDWATEEEINAAVAAYKRWYEASETNRKKFTLATVKAEDEAFDMLAQHSTTALSIAHRRVRMD